MVEIPHRLKDERFRFYLVGKHQKLPIEKMWNDTVNYPYYHSRLQEHIKRGGNYGVVTGKGNLIVIDFDDETYYKEMRDKLPKTFTTISAGKRMPHMYYILEGDMIQKKGIDKNNKRVCDIQGARSGVVAPNSRIYRHFYDIRRDQEITTITKEELEKIFKINVDKPKEYNFKRSYNPTKITDSIRKLRELGIKQTGPKLFRCPFHEMHGKGNLAIMPNGWIHCFHENKTWTLESFERDMKNV